MPLCLKHKKKCQMFLLTFDVSCLKGLSALESEQAARAAESAARKAKDEAQLLLETHKDGKNRHVPTIHMPPRYVSHTAIPPPPSVSNDPDQYVYDTYYLQWVPVSNIMPRPTSPRTIIVTL